MPDKKEYKAAVYCRVAIEPTTALYCRTANKSYLPENIGIENQKARLLHFAKENGYTNPVLYIDNGESGLTLDRPAMNRLTDDIKSGKIKTVIVTSADRIARGIDLLMEWICFVKGTGVRCLSLETDGQDVRTAFEFWRDLLHSLIPGLSKLDGAYSPFRNARAE